MPTYAVITFGCRVNQADSLRIEEDLRARGASAAPAQHADVVVVNTCSVTASADQGARQTIRRIARDNPQAKVIVTGCYATRRPDEIPGLPNVVRVIGNGRKEAVPEAAADALELTTAERFGNGTGACGAPIEPGIAGRTAFTLRVQTGCEETCAYCIIPATRGPGRSVPVADVVREVERIADAGFKEIVLTGVHLGSYGRDLTPHTSLVDLLAALEACRADVTFRISSLEPMDCTKDIVELVARSRGRFAPHFHLPLQHASDRVLTAMRRPYGIREYRRLVDRIVERIPAAAIGTDVIAGFPGETDDDFDATITYLRSAPLSHLHVFPYSDRPGTAASRMTGKVPGAVVRERAARLREVGAALARRFRQAQVGTIRPALTLEGGATVVTDNYLKLAIFPALARNLRVRVRVDDERSGTVLGQEEREEQPVSANGRHPT